MGLPLAPMRGGPDYNKAAAAIASTQIDPGLAAEFAALGFSRLDSQGRPALVETWREGFASWVITGGGKASVNGTQAYTGAVSARLDGLGVAAPVITKQIAVTASQRIGLEFAIYFEALPVTFDIVFSLDGSGNAGFIQMSRAAARWRVKNAGGAFTNLTSNPGAGIWQFVKVIIDYSSVKYVAALISDVTTIPTRQDISAVTLNTFVPGIRITNTTDGAGQQANIGYLVLSVDEP